MAVLGVRDVFAPITATEGGKPTAAADYALSLAEACDAHATLAVIAHRYVPPYSLAPGFVASLTEPANAEEARRLEAMAAALRTHASVAGRRHVVLAEQLTHDQATALAARQARLHDLSVMDEPQSFLTWGRALAEELIFHSGRPLIVVPGTVRTFRADRILVAWDGTAKAARALNDALPFLRSASHVEIVSVTGEKDLSGLPPGTEVAAHLSRHGVHADVVGIDAAAGDAGSALRERAGLTNADLIVMGAFAHARWRQFVFGGVTDSMLSNAVVPVFFSS